MTRVATVETQPALTDRWYVVHSKPRQESVALRNLLNQGYKAWLPHLTRWSRRGERWNRLVSPMFPRYLFLQPGHVRQGIGSVRSTYGVSGLVQFGGIPAQMSGDIVEALWNLEQALRQAPQDMNASPFAPGMAVRIADGALRGLEGIVTQAARDRVCVLLSLLGREKEVALDADTLVLS